MVKLTKNKLEGLLTRRLRLVDPEFRLEKVAERLIGNVISSTFKGKRDHERQKMIWDALESELGKESVLLVGMLLAFTPDEWNLDADQKTIPKAKKAG